ncbi:multidrug efflux SMR transporter [Pediococcus inopinatus]|uniref:DMT family transporter n=1 Tax=Pediococcus inopinatus TaxID=114090 RepID=UPI002B261F24|nr:multidrug efflux SMR transporter [Pediococcus inopinatus]WPC17255.1 multidrug efflux SMR transporter [Pediococcus inopinatus]
MGYLYLSIAVAGELLGTNLLKASNGFTRTGFSIGSLVAYALCFYFLSIAMKTINLSIAYALWAGVGIAATTVLSVLIWHEQINLTIVLGIILIVAGSILLNLHVE